MQLLQWGFGVSGCTHVCMGVSKNSTSFTAKLASANSPNPLPSAQSLTSTDGGRRPCSVCVYARENISESRLQLGACAAGGLEAEVLHAVEPAIGLVEGGGSHNAFKASSASTAAPKSRGRPKNSSKSWSLPSDEVDIDTVITRAHACSHRPLCTKTSEECDLDALRKGIIPVCSRTLHARQQPTCLPSLPLVCGNR
jgi:hypothetical protein